MKGSAVRYKPIKIIVYMVLWYIFQKKKNIPKHNIILIIFKCCVSKTTLIVLITYLKYTYDHIALNFQTGVGLFPTISLYLSELRISQKEKKCNEYKYRWDQYNHSSTNWYIEHLHFCMMITNTRSLSTNVGKYEI